MVQLCHTLQHNTLYLHVTVLYHYFTDMTSWQGRWWHQGSCCCYYNSTKLGRV